MRPSTTRFLSGIVMVAFLGCGVVGAEAGSGSDAGVGISGKLDYDHPANGSGPAIIRRHYKDGLRHSAAELASYFNFSPTRGEIASAFAAVSRMDAAIRRARNERQFGAMQVLRDRRGMKARPCHRVSAKRLNTQTKTPRRTSGRGVLRRRVETVGLGIIYMNDID